MDFWAIEILGELDVRQIAWNSLFNWKFLLAFEKNLSLHHQKKTPSLY